MRAQIIGWDKFENAKSRTYKMKSQGSIPINLGGSGYRRMMREDDGPAMYGCFIALAMIVHSSGSKDREGYLTDTGGILGGYYDIEDLSLKTSIPEALIERTISFCSGSKMGWMAIVEDTAGIPQGYHADTAGDYSTSNPTLPNPTLPNPINLDLPDIGNTLEPLLFRQFETEWRKSSTGLWNGNRTRKRWNEAITAGADAGMLIERIANSTMVAGNAAQGFSVCGSAVWLEEKAWDDQLTAAEISRMKSDNGQQATTGARQTGNNQWEV